MGLCYYSPINHSRAWTDIIMKDFNIGPLKLQINTPTAQFIVDDAYRIRKGREIDEKDGAYKFVLSWNNTILFGGAFGRK